MLHISIKSEEIFRFMGLSITNSLLASGSVMLFFIFFSLIFFILSKKNSSTFVFFVRFINQSLYSMFEPIMKDKVKRFYPLLASLFLFILISNWFGLIPGVGSVVITRGVEEFPTPLFRGATADLNTTLALAVIAFVLIQYNGIKYLGAKEYLKKFINLAGPVDFFTGILEIVSEFSKIISFAFRLFGNIFAGEVLLVVVAFLIPILASFPFLLLEIFVGIVQALVFSLLTAIFLNLAVSKHH